MTTIKILGQEWVSPGTRYWESGQEGRQPTPYGGAVAIQTNCGILLLANVELFVETGEIRRTLVKPEDVKAADYP